MATMWGAEMVWPNPMGRGISSYALAKMLGHEELSRHPVHGYDHPFLDKPRISSSRYSLLKALDPIPGLCL